MSTIRSFGLIAVLLLNASWAAAQGDDTAGQRQMEINASAQATLDKLFSQQAATRELYERSSGYAVFTATDVERVAAEHGLRLREIVDMPANNFSLVFER
jgi:hypothetical protein